MLVRAMLAAVRDSKRTCMELQAVCVGPVARHVRLATQQPHLLACGMCQNSSYVCMLSCCLLSWHTTSFMIVRFLAPHQFRVGVPDDNQCKGHSQVYFILSGPCWNTSNCSMELACSCFVLIAMVATP